MPTAFYTEWIHNPLRHIVHDICSKISLILLGSDVNSGFLMITGCSETCFISFLYILISVFFEVNRVVALVINSEQQTCEDLKRTKAHQHCYVENDSVKVQTEKACGLPE